MLTETGAAQSKTAGALKLYPQVLVNVSVGTARDALSGTEVKRAVKEVETELDGSGRVLLRPSGTEPVIRVMVEGRDGGRVRRGADHIAAAVRKAV